MNSKENELIGKEIEPVVNEPQEIGIDTDEEMINALIDGVISDTVDLNTLDSFSNMTQSRETVYQVIDTMASDDRVSAILETFTEDIVEPNDKGQIVWCESNDEDITNYVTYLLDVLNIDKHAKEWVYSFLRYGDIFLKLYRESDYEKDKDILFKNKDDEKKDSRSLFEGLDDIDEKDTLNEDVKVAIHSDNDHYVHYVEMVPNPGEMFELQKFGKTRCFIKAPINIQNIDATSTVLSNYLTYKLKQKDVTVYGATDFVHASLTNSNNLRTPEEIKIFKDDEAVDADECAGVYQVRRGQSMLYNKFRVWRQLCLTENSILLDRVTKSALTRIISVNITGMPKNSVKLYLARLKEKIEQKTALSTASGSINEYTNSGPVVNSIFAPVRDNNQGLINVQTVGGEYDPKQLTDLDHLETRFYGSFKAPKAYFNLTDDGAGFNGGESLAIISSRYGKGIKDYQNDFCQLITDLINLFLVDAGYDRYINNFRIKMQTPVTKEEVDRRENQRNRMGIISDVMQQAGGLALTDVDKLKLYKELLSTAINDTSAITIIQDRIDALEKEEAERLESEKDKKKKSKETPEEERGPRRTPSAFENQIGFGEETPEAPTETSEEEVAPAEETTGEEESSYLPSPDELSLDLTGNQ